jgi:two-component sensor histidine kinase
MTLHELATNAMKYGALSNSDGQVTIAWSRTAVGSERRFVIAWREEGGPRVEPPTYVGYGRTVIEQMAAYALRGEVELRYDPGGISWRLSAPEGEVVCAEGQGSHTPLPA